MKPIAIPFAAACSVLLAACASTPPPAPLVAPAAPAGSAREAVANLAAASGSLVSGRLVLVPMADGVHLSGEIGGLPPGSSHGFHIHEKGDCSAVDASSAGDADNLVADGNGVARVDVHVAGVSLGTGAANDIAGRAIIVHAAPDDYRSQPAGNAGARIACGVIRLTQ